MANRHGLIAGATGTGKTVTLRVLAERFSQIGVPVFMADVKGDLAGLSQPGNASDKILQRLAALGIDSWTPQAYPVVLWDIFGQEGHPMRTTVSELGPVLLARLLNLNETQAGVLTIAFKVADDAGLLLLDLKDLHAMLVHLGEHSREFTLEYGNVSTASIGAIQRALLALKENGGDLLFGEPSLVIEDLLQTDTTGRGVINILNAEKLLNSPLVYSTLLLWLLSELFEKLPEVGDLDKPKLVFFFDEAHLLFNGAPRALIERIEQVVRLIRSKGVGVYFVSQSPLDIADTVLSQLGNRIQHALRAFTVKDQKAIRATAETFRTNGLFDIQVAIGHLGIGEAIISLLDEQGAPYHAEQALVIPPESRISAISPDERRTVITSSTLYGTYEKSIDRESAYEILKQRMEESSLTAKEASQDLDEETDRSVLSGIFRESATSKSKRRSRQGPLEAMIVSIARSIGSQIGRSISRGLLGSLTNKRR